MDEQGARLRLLRVFERVEIGPIADIAASIIRNLNVIPLRLQLG